MKKLILIIILFVSLSNIQAQNCKVLLKSMSETYIGECKRGKADGHGTAKGIDCYTGEFKKGYPEGIGTYTWSNGDAFEGTFKKGEKEGQGKMIYKTTTLKDSIVSGFWKRDKYVGLYEFPYKKIDKSANVIDLRFTKTDDAVNKVRLYIREDNTLIHNPQINIVVHYGLYQDIRTLSDFVEITRVTFPLKLRATYGREHMEIEILQSGSWEVGMIIENIKGLENTGN